jgi:hypothetical protein
MVDFFHQQSSYNKKMQGTLEGMLNDIQDLQNTVASLKQTGPVERKVGRPRRNVQLGEKE